MITFACPSCAAKGSADEAVIGKQVRCKLCGRRFAAGIVVESQPDVYQLTEPSEEPAEVGERNMETGSAFVSTRSREPMSAFKPRKSRSVQKGSKGRPDREDIDWRFWLIRGGIVAAIGLGVIALIVPKGTVIAGSAVIVVGCALALAGFLVGAFGAFREDSLYGFLYVFIPLYTGYYLLSRWEDMWLWFVCSAAGVGLIVLGNALIRWAAPDLVVGLMI